MPTLHDVTACPLEGLPQELLDTIVGFLSPADIARLGECSERLSHRLSEALYLTPKARNTALRWACTLDLPRVMRLVGGPQSTVDIPKTRRNHEPTGHQRAEGGTARVLTLHLASKGGHARVFGVLLRHGVRIDDTEVHPLQQRIFFSRLCAQPHADFLLPFLKSGLPTQLPQPMLNELLLESIKAGAAADLVEQVLDFGADPNYLQRQGSRTMCPVAAAAVRGTPDVFQLLLQKGAHDNGPHLDRIIRRPLHVPLYALAHAAYTRGIGAVVDGFKMYLTHTDADINQLAWLPCRWLYMYHEICATPFLFYLHSIESWEVEATPRHELAIRWLVDNGALVIPQKIPQLYKENWGHKRPSAVPRVDTPTPIELLLDSWGLEQLTVPGFLNMLKLLAAVGAAPIGSIGQFLSRYKTNNLGHKAKDAVIAPWQELVHSIASLGEPHSLRPNQVLREYITAVDDSFMSFTAYFSDLIPYTIDALLAAGADINWSSNDQPRTALFELCREDASLACTGLNCKGEQPHGSWQWVPSALRRRVTPPRVSLYQYLLDRGADPDAEWGGMTAVQVLEDGWQRCSEARCSGEKPFLKLLVDLMNGRKVGYELQDRGLGVLTTGISKREPS